MKNVELKAVIDDPEKVRRKAEELGASFKWTALQVDRYWTVPRGKLKLRQQEGAGAELIAYMRPDEAQAKVSEYVIYRSQDGDRLAETLSRVLVSDVVVRKRRTLYLWQNVRIHLDEVEGLGSFIEFEAVTAESDLESAQEKVSQLISYFHITPAMMISGGYADLMKQKERKSASQA